MTTSIDTTWMREISSNAAALCRTCVAAPWGMKIAACDGVMFHYVVSGACLLRGPAIATLRLAEGDLLLVPNGLDHDLVSDLEVSPEPLEEFLDCPSRLVTGQPVSTLLCGVYLLGAKFVHPSSALCRPSFIFPSRRCGPVHSFPRCLTCSWLKSRPQGQVASNLFSICSIHSSSLSSARGPKLCLLTLPDVSQLFGTPFSPARSLRFTLLLESHGPFSRLPKKPDSRAQLSLASLCRRSAKRRWHTSRASAWVWLPVFFSIPIPPLRKWQVVLVTNRSSLSAVLLSGLSASPRQATGEIVFGISTWQSPPSNDSWVAGYSALTIRRLCALLWHISSLDAMDHS
jgi:hypothetical protein